MWGNWPPVQVSYTITVPRAFNLQLKTSGGNVKVGFGQRQCQRAYQRW